MTSDFLWWRDGVIYQIYPRSFKDSNGDGIGDLIGIISGLDYLQDLGVDAIWLSPVYPSPDVDFGYDVSDYHEIHPHFGSMEDFNHLVREAHRRNIHIIMDLVLNHSSNQHAWFQKSRESSNNEYANFYLWRPGQSGNRPPNNWLSVFGGPGWDFDAQHNQYYFHMFYKEQPDLNWHNPRVRQEMLDIFRFWLDKGVDGFRLDVFNAYFKDKNFTDNPRAIWGIRPFERMQHIYDMDQPELMDFLRELRLMLDGYPESYVIGETFLGDHRKAARYCAPDLLHAAFNFNLINRRWRADFYKERFQEWQSVLPEDAWPSLVFNNHDNQRSATRFGLGEDDARLKVAAALLLTLRGTPFLYAGEEIGMRDIRITRDEVQDPIGKYYWPFFKGRDGCRSPMQWNDSINAGFTTGQPWLRVHKNYSSRNVNSQISNPYSLLNFYKKVLTIRRNSSALQSGTIDFLPMKDTRILGFVRRLEKSEKLVLLNFSSSSANVSLPEFSRSANVILSSTNRSGVIDLNEGVCLHPDEALILDVWGS